MRKPRTHFEQIPLEVVKKIAAEDLSREETAATDTVSVEPVSNNSERRAPARALGRKRR